MAWRDSLARLGVRAEAEMERLVAAWQAGRIDDDRFVVLAAALVARWAGRAVVAADLAVAVTLARQVTGLPVQVDQRRLRDAVKTVLDPDTAPTTTTFETLTESQAFRLGRLAKAETYDHGQDATQEALDRQGVPGWVRQTDAEPCPLCQGWADGVVRPMSVRMKRHVGCTCVQQPASLPEGAKARPEPVVPRQKAPDAQQAMDDIFGRLARTQGGSVDDVVRELTEGGRDLIYEP